MAIESSEQVQAVATASGRARLPLRSALLFFLFLNCVYLLTSSGRVRTIDEIDPVLQSESLVLRHSTAIPQAVNSGIYFGERDQNGAPRSAWPFGHAVLIAPWSAVGHWMARLPGMPRGISDLTISAATCWSNATYAALTAAALFLLFFGIAGGEIAERQRLALACGLVMAFATPLFVYSGWLYSEPVTAALFVTAALLLLGTGREVEWPRALAGAILLGFSIHVRPANMVTVLIFIAASVFLNRADDKKGYAFRTAAILVCVMAVSGGLYFVRNHVFFGNAFDFGVPATAENGKDIESWHNPFWRGVVGFLFSPGKSVFLFCPPMILGILGLPHLWRRNRALTVLAAAAPLGNLLLYSFRTQWEGSYCYGPRYLLPSLMLFCLPIAALLSDARLSSEPASQPGTRQEPPLRLRTLGWLRPVFWITVISGFAVQAVGLSTNILEDMVRNHYYNANWDYQMSYSAISGQLRLTWKYLHVAPAGVGLGWDRWFVLLRSAGANPALVSGITWSLLAGALLFGLLTWRSVCRADR